MKILIWGLIVFVVVYWILRHNKSRIKPDGIRRDGAQQAAESRESAEAMLKCAHCGVHIPASEALSTRTGAVYCSDAHRLLHPGD